MDFYRRKEFQLVEQMVIDAGKKTYNADLSNKGFGSNNTLGRYRFAN